MSDIRLHFYDAKTISTGSLPGPSFVLRMADEESLLAPIKDMENVRCVSDFLFNDADSSYGLVRSPTQKDAGYILGYFDMCSAPNFVAQCQAGKGRSQAVVAALCQKLGRDCTPILRNGTYNRTLYKLLMAEIGRPVVEPLVSIVVRLKYDASRINAFMLSMERQRHENWEVIAVTDGPIDWTDRHRCLLDERCRTITTIKSLGHWGHPYRQAGIDATDGKYIGLQNDDNIVCPGWIEQMVLAMELAKADLAACQVVHSYSGWSVTGPGSDLCSWIARADLIRRHPWTGIDADYEWHYLKALEADGKCVVVERPLVVKC